MPRKQPARSIPTGPGRADPGLPRFADDPIAWFARLDELLTRDPAAVRLAQPETWTDDDGHHWRVVATDDGPEVRPGLESPFLVHGRLPRITSLLISPPAIKAELSMRDWRQVTAIPVGTCSVRDLGLAMLTGVELPHDSLERVGAETWELAASRWSARPAASRSAERNRLTSS
jgi:hypothetical protein